MHDGFFKVWILSSVVFLKVVRGIPYKYNDIFKGHSILQLLAPSIGLWEFRWKPYFYSGNLNHRALKIQIYEFTEGAEKACGLTVIIDVLRAFSVACYLFHRGIRSLRITEHVHHAFQLQKHDPNLVLVGERNERKVPGFHFGNSPNEIIHADLSGKDVVQTTSAGTLGLSRATSADILITGSFVNAGAIIQYIRIKNPEQVSLVAMGYRAQTSADEDRLCAEYIKKQLEGTPIDFQNMIFTIRNGSGNRFFNPLNRDHSPPEDFELCMALNRFPFILLATPKQDGIHLNKISSSSFD